jgi:hypothetical protein
MVSRSSTGSRRSRSGHRQHRITVRVSDSEKAAIGEAAGRAGMAVAAWLGQTGLDAAMYRVLPVPVMHRELLGELALTRAKLGVAAGRLASGGPEAASAAAYCAQAARQLEDAADRIRGLPR